MRSQVTEHLEVLVTKPGQLYGLLDDAEAVLRQEAKTQQFVGILVTRHDPGRYTFALGNTLPLGETREADTLVTVGRRPHCRAVTGRKIEGNNVCYIR